MSVLLPGQKTTKRGTVFLLCLPLIVAFWPGGKTDMLISLPCQPVSNLCPIRGPPRFARPVGRVAGWQVSLGVLLSRTEGWFLTRYPFYQLYCWPYTISPQKLFWLFLDLYVSIPGGDKPYPKWTRKQWQLYSIIIIASQYLRGPYKISGPPDILIHPA